MNQPQGFEVKMSKVYQLKKAIYGLKQAPIDWYSEIDSHFTKCGFKKSRNEATLYTKTENSSDILIVSIYMDDVIFTRNSKRMVDEFRNEMMGKYEMIDLGYFTIFLEWE